MKDQKSITVKISELDENRISEDDLFLLNQGFFQTIDALAHDKEYEFQISYLLPLPHEIDTKDISEKTVYKLKTVMFCVSKTTEHHFVYRQFAIWQATRILVKYMTANTDSLCVEACDYGWRYWTDQETDFAKLESIYSKLLGTENHIDRQDVAGTVIRAVCASIDANITGAEAAYKVFKMYSQLITETGDFQDFQEDARRIADILKNPIWPTHESPMEEFGYNKTICRLQNSTVLH